MNSKLTIDTRPVRDNSRSIRTKKHPAPRSIRGNVYIASPLQTYPTERYDAKIRRLRHHFPNASVLPARDLFASTVDWRQRWPEIVTTLTALVFFDDGEGWI